MNTQEKATEIAKAVMRNLNDRKGYDDLWDNLESRVRQELMMSLTQTIRKELERPDEQSRTP